MMWYWQWCDIAEWWLCLGFGSAEGYVMDNFWHLVCFIMKKFKFLSDWTFLFYFLGIFVQKFNKSFLSIYFVESSIWFLYQSVGLKKILFFFTNSWIKNFGNSNNRISKLKFFVNKKVFLIFSNFLCIFNKKNKKFYLF